MKGLDNYILNPLNLSTKIPLTKKQIETLELFDGLIDKTIKIKRSEVREWKALENKGFAVVYSWGKDFSVELTQSGKNILQMYLCNL